MDNSGFEGLGAINGNKSTNYLESPNGFLVKRDTDSRKIVTDFTRFTSVEHFNNYLKSWFNSTGIVSVSEVEDSIKAQLNFSHLFYTMWKANKGNTSGNNCFCIISCLNLDNVQTIINLLYSSNNSIFNTKAVIMYYGNVGKDIRNKAKRLGIELIGTDEIYEINQAIDSAYRGMPYMSFNGTKFKTTLANKLNHLYRTEGARQQITNSVAVEANSLGNSIGGALGDGVNQFKDSVGELINSMKHQEEVYEDNTK